MLRLRLILLGCLGAAPALAQQSLETLARGSLARIDGRTSLKGLQDKVEILRDRWGVPHIYAKNLHDLFFAQGYVQAQDRLWQMDLSHRIWSGELSEILGPAYLAHDRLIRLLRYRGPFDDREWRSYHPEGRKIFEAFAEGVNAFIASAGGKLPVEFKLTGLRPKPWTPEASVLRAQTAFPVGDARAELTLAQRVVQYGAAEANRRARPSPYRDLVVPAGIDLSLITDDVRAALSGIRDSLPQVPLLPRYQKLAAARPPDPAVSAPPAPPGSNNWVVSGRLTRSGKVLLANDPHRNVGNPSIRYIVHLDAPGWGLIGATEPMLPGVAIGHSGRIAWGLTIVGTDQTDVYVETVNPADRNQVRFRGQWEPLRVIHDTIRVKGAAPVVVTLKYSRHGPVFYQDTLHHLAYALKSTMYLPGSAGYLGALRYHALSNCREFLDAQVYWLAPTENMICGDTAGNIAWQASAASPKRPNWHGRLPVPGTGEYEWDGLRDDLPRELNPERGWIATANHDIHPAGYDPPLFFKAGREAGRYDRLASLLTRAQPGSLTVEEMERMQHDAFNWAAAQNLPRFKGWTAADPELERARALLAEWDGWQRKESAAAALYWFVGRRLSTRGDSAASEGSTPSRERLETALRLGLDSLKLTQGPDPADWRWGRINTSRLRHAMVKAYDIPPVERLGGAGTVAASGATFREVIDFADLDNSKATNVPGQSGQPRSPFYANLAEPFGRGEYFPLSYSRPAVERNAAHRLILVPAH